MMHKLLPFFFLLTIGLSLVACKSDIAREGIDFTTWGGYWFKGEAEITSFTLEQARYGEVHPGEAVLIYVTEDFSKKKQVKLDDPRGKDVLNVLKLNSIREFETGVYKYNTMVSIFTPTKVQRASPKITASVQEWCGQSFTQLNHNSDDGYSWRMYSYFESEGDQSGSVNGLAEDELWTLLRIQPEAIPTGSVKLFPSVLENRLRHVPIEAHEAFIRIQDISESRRQLEVTYGDTGRTLKIDFLSAFPHEILGWEESQSEKGGGIIRTKATRKAIKKQAYWKNNRLEDSFLRQELKLR
ncbi:hypothetical protein A3SI_10459 [Nitritalea halalkaliphila LW7]|uniref:Septum formation inhibitor Maf n=1 Tax=Nitritalea halalkaliphila LW7 TaxID=1189621 RepID=I5C3M6_9BACT|nr:hypothetical protein [Nitritalea halalkaliphila]EIM76428.1 hypothetical protein A3SI_10459 [Nitritalea halalkaliphila LW7]